MTDVVQKRSELDAKQKALKQVWEDAGADIDFDKLKCLGENMTTFQKTEKVRSLDKELNDLFDEVRKLEDIVNLKASSDRREQERKGSGSGEPFRPPSGGSRQEPQSKSLGQLLVEDAGYKAAVEAGKKRFDVELKAYPSDIFRDSGIKTLFQTSAGWSPESTRIGLVVDAVARPIQVVDLIPANRTSQAAVVWMEETTRTNAAAERAEGAAYAESAFALTQRSSTVRSIGTSIPVTDEQLADEPMVQGYLTNRLMFGCRQRLDGQLLVGDGIAPNLLGVNNASGIQTQAKGGDPTPDTFYKAMTKVKVTGRAFPNAHVIHPNDWQDIRLLRTADGIYIWGNPSEAGPMRLWGLPVVDSDAQTEGTGLTGDFANFSALFERQGVEVEVGYVGDQFKEGEKTMRAGIRVAFIVTRGAAFCQSTGI